MPSEKGSLSARSHHSGESAVGDTIRNKLNADEALRIVQPHDARPHIDEETNRRLLRKIDWIIMPAGGFLAVFLATKGSALTNIDGPQTLCIVYGLNFLDKTALSYASVTGLQQAIHLKGDEYSWLGSAFYLGYLGFEFVAVRLLQYLPLAKYSAFCVFAWGVTIACFSLVESFRGALAVRILLGAFEASVSPGWTLFTSQWYRNEEQAIRVAWWVSFNGWAQIFGGLVAYGFANGSTYHGYTIPPWKAIFILLGLLTIVFSIIMALTIPDSPATARWLTPQDRVLVIERIRKNQQGIGNKHFKFYQLKESFTDPAVWAIYFLALVGDLPNGGLTNFFSLLIKSFGYSTEATLLYGCISGVIEVVTLLAWGYASQRYGHRLMLGSLGLLAALVGSVLLVALPLSNNHGRLAGFFLTQFFPIGLVCVISIIASNIAGYTKKTVVAGGFFIFYSAGNIIGPQTFRSQDAPTYRPAEITLIVCYGACFLDLVFLHCWYRYQNRKKDLAQAQSNATVDIDRAFLDLTDRENPDFRYVS